MNKILTSTGGYPLRLEDIEDLQGFIGDVLKGIAAAFGDCILSGCEIREAGNDRHIMPGYICYRGNIYAVSEQMLPDMSRLQNLYWVLSEETKRTVMYEDGHEEASRRLFRAKLIKSTVKPSTLYLPFDLPRLGVDFARPPRLRCEVTGAKLVDFIQFSSYSGVITINHLRHITLGNTHWNIVIDGTKNITGSTTMNLYVLGKGIQVPVTFTVNKGKVTVTTSSKDCQDDDQLHFSSTLTLFLTWQTAFEEEEDLDLHMFKSKDTEPRRRKDEPPFAPK